jgi:hypothetical protein
MILGHEPSGFTGIPVLASSAGAGRAPGNDDVVTQFETG